jgi:hypothetical protein
MLVAGTESLQTVTLFASDYYVNHPSCPLNWTERNQLQQTWARLRTIAKMKHKSDDGSTVRLIDSQPMDFISSANRNPRVNNQLLGWTEESYVVPDGVILRLQYRIDNKTFGGMSHQSYVMIRTRSTGPRHKISFKGDYGLPYLAIGYFDILSPNFVKEQKLIAPQFFGQIDDTINSDFLSVDIIEKAKYDIAETGVKVITVEGKPVEILERKRKRNITL